MSIELKLKRKDLNWLNKGFENSSMISPMSLIEEEVAFDAADKKRLVDLGVINEANEISAEVFPVLEVISKADGFTQTRFARGPISAEKLIYSFGNLKVSVVYDQDDVVINSPANPQGMVLYLKDFMGGSTLTGGDLSLDISALDAFILSVIIDLYRKDVFRAYAEEEVFVCQGFDKGDLLEKINTIRSNSQNFSYHIFVVNGGFDLVTMEELERSLSSLKEQGLIMMENERYFPAGEGLLFAGNFLIFENIVEVVVGQVKGDELFRSNFLILQAGPLDIVYIEKSEDNIIIECMPSTSAIEFINGVISEKPNII